ncbi:hypothetical protein JB92DRAFT_3093264 [Gautieria morchelliformis]|nr:hypothetical protein JB92DRAFT_3093264 [Gautieria morchelliformis]
MSQKGVGFPTIYDIPVPLTSKGIMVMRVNAMCHITTCSGAASQLSTEVSAPLLVSRSSRLRQIVMSSISTPVEHEDFWFEEGDVVLSVTEDGVEHRFCVHRLILKIASPIFRDMLWMPRPSGDEDCWSLFQIIQSKT